MSQSQRRGPRADMVPEIAAAVGFVSNLLRTRGCVSEQQLQVFSGALREALAGEARAGERSAGRGATAGPRTAHSCLLSCYPRRGRTPTGVLHGGPCVAPRTWCSSLGAHLCPLRSGTHLCPSLTPSGVIIDAGYLLVPLPACPPMSLGTGRHLCVSLGTHLCPGGVLCKHLPRPLK